MSKIQSPRGTRDILPDQQAVWRFVRQKAEAVATQLNFRPITTPTYEQRELFQRSIGEGTDVMDKELFLTRGIETPPGEEEYVLRPEGTAGIVRAYIEHGMQTWPQPVKLWSIVNNFRYDRPQKGRYREHTQFDIEIFGDAAPWADAWTILTTWRFLIELGIPSEKLMLKLNSLGTTEERQTYVDALKNHLESKRGELSEDSQRRLETNPLRILDSKDENDQRLVADAPTFADFLGEVSRNHIGEVRRLLTLWNIPFVEEGNLVRGLDYYCHTTFEWVPVGEGGQQSSIGGGGRYDGLMRQLEGPDTPAVGAGIGLDRVVDLLIDLGIEIPELSKPDIFLIAADEQGREFLEREILPKLVSEGKSVDAAFGKDMGGQMKAADRSGAKEAWIMGEQEMASGEPTKKPLRD